MGRKEWLDEARSFGWFLNYGGSCYLFTDCVSYIILDKDSPRAVKSTRLVVFNCMPDNVISPYSQNAATQDTVSLADPYAWMARGT